MSQNKRIFVEKRGIFDVESPKIFDEVKAGGDRQEIHEVIRVHSMEASKKVKMEGKEKDLIERIMNNEYRK